MSILMSTGTLFNSPYASTSALAAVNMTDQFNGVLAYVTDSGLYKYSKQATSGTFAATGGGYWTITTDYPSILLNANNQIDGSQIENVGTIVLPNGTALNPSIYFTNSTACGFYLVSTDVLGVSTSGALVASFTSSGLNLASGKVLQVNAVQVVGARDTGWTAWTGTLTKGGFATGTATLVQVCQVVAAIQAALTTHGLIGT